MFTASACQQVTKIIQTRKMTFWKSRTINYLWTYRSYCNIKACIIVPNLTWRHTQAIGHYEQLWSINYASDALIYRQLQKTLYTFYTNYPVYSTWCLQWWANLNRDWDLNGDLNTFGEWFDSLKIRFGNRRLGFDSIRYFLRSVRFDGRIIAGCCSSVLFSV